MMRLLAKRLVGRLLLDQPSTHEIVDGLAKADDRSRRSFSMAATTSSARVIVVRML
jgi:hypothetical protein